MLPRTSSTRVGSCHARHLLRPTFRPAVSRQARGAVGSLASQQKRAISRPSIAETPSNRRLYQPKVSATSPRLVSTRRQASTNASAELRHPDDDHAQAPADATEEKNAGEIKAWEESELVEDQVDEQELVSRADHTAESWVHLVRQQFRERIPADVLDEEEIKIFTRLYGEPMIDEVPYEPIEESGNEADRLYRQDRRGGWEEIEYGNDRDSAETKDNAPLVYDMDVGPVEKETLAMRRTREVAEQLGGEVMLEQFENEAVPDDAPRSHPLTLEGKFGPSPSTIHPPKSTLTGPISVILSDFSNRHISETAHQLFGGPGLPHSTTTAPPRAQLPQLPIPLHASQHHMGGMEANAYLAALYPGIYASTLSVLVEVRKRLGTDWIRNLISQDGGPNVLDAGGGGAGILAWRDIVRAEWELMVPDHPDGASIPSGRSTVLTGSDALRLRASAILDNTSFLPRLPDYIHVREKPTLDDSRAAPKRKQYDVIIAPHSLLGFEEDYQRKEYVDNLWALLNPNGGILILLEKGRQKGFEAIAGAREMLLKRHIASPGSTEYEDFVDSPGDSPTVEKETGMIVAPCTNHSTCPMHNPAGPTKGRRDYCHFEQRYIRPPFLQRIMGAKDRNHEDLKFSYLAVQRGVDQRQNQNIRQDVAATDAAFEGYEHPEETDPVTFNPLSVPRAVYPPIKRRGHVIFDLCTPAGQIERWTVPRSYSRQAYRDARKSNWGDLWALGAKTRIPRKLNLGEKHGEGKKERLARRLARSAREEDELDEFDEAEDGEEHDVETQTLGDIPELPTRKKGQNIPSWKKHADKKKLRQALKKRGAAEDAL
ncbi:hypothetical protein N7492_008856 [Penicillium capsulatum]|uniref:37S ribosomal protein Rsm22 n=1 Tax=Penicillium capsulatum TaxID=69766 RepID=A0A9W9HQI1_9EURO|nr:hypothetical protein N7492_008856 [Penicillium capsulatum]KAJ6106258.1 hypothetical protein N7512_009775 [Penicillium capsulatum]